MIVNTNRSGAHSVIRKSYEFNNERVHLMIDPAEGQLMPRYRCDSCGRVLEADCFTPISKHHAIGSRVARKFKYVAILHPNCTRCRRSSRNKYASHPLFSPELDEVLRKLTTGARGGARTRGIVFGIEKDDVLGLFLSQGGCCAISGIELDWKELGSATRSGRNYRGPSIDRIDSAGNYVLGNVHVVAQVVNIMKNDLPVNQFVALCRQIANHNISL